MVEAVDLRVLNDNKISLNVNSFKKILIVGDYQFRYNYKLLEDIYSLNLNPKL